MALLAAAGALTALHCWCFALPGGLSGLPTARGASKATRGAAVARQASYIEVPGQLKNGMAIVVDEEPYVVLTHQNKKQGKGVAICKTKLKNLKTGAQVEKTLQSGKKYEEVVLDYKDATYSYRDADGNLVFMDVQVWEEMTLSSEIVGEDADWLKEGMLCDVMLYEGQPLRFRIREQITAKVVATEERGDSQTKSSKPVTLDNGVVKSGPFYLSVGDTVEIDPKNHEITKRL